MIANLKCSYSPFCHFSVIANETTLENRSEDGSENRMKDSLNAELQLLTFCKQQIKR